MGMLFLPRLLTEYLDQLGDWLVSDNHDRQVLFMPERLADADAKADTTRRGAEEVLGLFLSQETEDDIFVRWMTWGVVMLILAIWCITKLDVTVMVHAV